MAVLRRLRDHQVFWSLAPCIPQELLRELLLISRAHVYTYSGDCIYTSGDNIAIHACSEGAKRVYLPYKGRAVDVRTGEELLSLIHIFAAAEALQYPRGIRRGGSGA